MLPMIRLLSLTSALALLGGCASSYDLTLMPRTSGTLYKGEAYRPAGSSEARVDIAIDGHRDHRAQEHLQGLPVAKKLQT